MQKTAKKPAKKASEPVLNINEIADLYQKLAVEAAKTSDRANEYKKLLLDYAKKNDDKFVDNKLAFPNGVYIENRSSLKSTFNDELLTYERLGTLIEIGYGDLVTVGLQDKAIQKILNEPRPSKKLMHILNEIKYVSEVKNTLAVYTK